METFILDHDIKVFYVTASSFPEGIQAAHEKLHNLVPFSPDRQYFGVSRPENGSIVYRAAAEEKYAGEAEHYHCDTLTLKAGTYISLMVYNFMENQQAITDAFQELITYPGLDPDGYCVAAWYLQDKDVRCMIRLQD